MSCARIAQACLKRRAEGSAFMIIDPSQPQSVCSWSVDRQLGLPCVHSCRICSWSTEATGTYAEALCTGCIVRW